MSIFLQASFFGFGQSAEVEIRLNEVEGRKTVEYRSSDKDLKDKNLLFYDGETVSGKVNIYDSDNTYARFIREMFVVDRPC